MLRRYGKSFGIIEEHEVDAVIDMSGFSYTDEWGPENAEKAAANFARWKKQGKQIVMLPQSFGPFKNPKTIAAMRTMIDHIDLVFAREPQSLQMLEGAVGARPQIKYAPDFTNLIDGKVPDIDRSGPYVCIVPNYLMVRKTTPEDRKEYLNFLALAVREVEHRNLRPLMLLHSPLEDIELVEPLASVVGHAVDVVSYEDPLLLKGVLGEAYAIIGSRFHALIGALSQHVPSVGLGWSQKFNHLFELYDSADLLTNASLPRSMALEKIRHILDEPMRGETQDRLAAAAARHLSISQQMWRDVEDVLGLARSEPVDRDVLLPTNNATRA